MAVTIEIDTSELDFMIDGLKKRLTSEQVNRVMGQVMHETGEHMKTVLKREIPEHYYVTPGEVGKAVGRARVTSGAGGTGCIIPVEGPRRSIGGGFPASGGSHGWKSVHRKYRVKARIVKGAQSTLPEKMNNYGGQPPFRNLGSKLGAQVYTRGAKGRLPIKKVVGIAIPQMPANRAREDVERALKYYLYKRMEARLVALVRGDG